MQVFSDTLLKPILNLTFQSFQAGTPFFQSYEGIPLLRSNCKPSSQLEKNN